MNIKLVNKGSRNQLICTTKNGRVEKADLGPNIPYHDLAHFVVEKHLNLKRGFYGNIYKGFTVEQLSDKQIIKSLPAESMVAEIVTRALQSLVSGACSADQFNELIHAEFNVFSIDFQADLTDNDIREMEKEYSDLVTQWKRLGEGGFIEMELTI